MKPPLKNRNTVLFLGPEELKGLITMEEAVAAVETGYAEAERYPLGNAPRRRVHSPDSVRVSNFPGGIPGLGVIGSMTRAERVEQQADESQTYPYREHPVYLIWDSKTSKLLSILMGEIFDPRTGYSSNMAFRTAATTGVGIKHMARKDARSIGLFGAGGQALNTLLAAKAVRDIRSVKVFSRNPENRKAFARRASELIGIEVKPVETPREVVAGADMVLCATSANVPVFDGTWLEPGQHVGTIVGSNAALVDGGWLKQARRENDNETARRADVIATNWVEGVFQDRQAGLCEPVELGLISKEKILSLGAIIEGRHPGRVSDQQITFHFNNAGTAAADLALAKTIYDRALKDGRGTELVVPLPGTQ